VRVSATLTVAVLVGCTLANRVHGTASRSVPPSAHPAVEVTLQNVGKTPLVYEDSCPLPGSLVRLAGADIAFLTRPSCNADGQQWSVLVGAPPGSTPRRIVWSVLVGAPGYAVASGTY